MTERPIRDDEERTPRGYRGATGRITGSYRPNADADRLQRSRQARQILSGAEIRPPDRTGPGFANSETTLTQPQMVYAVALGILLALGLLLWLIVGLGVASIFFFLLALGLLGGWLAF
jgi:Flp pilus assembly protein TadB